MEICGEGRVEILVDNGIKFRILNDRRVNRVELNSEPDIGRSLPRNNELQSHFVPNNSALISSHGRADGESA
jgi:hypothetical protein